jgi:N-acetylmuramoyl-L-alanine amidase
MGYRILTDEGSLYAASFLDFVGFSAHMLVAPDGTLIRCRDDGEGAWHARDFNTDSLGIEVLVDGEHNYETFVDAIQRKWVTPEQYRATVDVVAHWCHGWGIDTDPGSLDRHSDVDPERKVDPGQGFPWARFVGDVERMR